MTALVLVFCLQSTPATCVEVRPMLEKVPAMECLAHGQLYAAHWLEENPKWRLSGWRCEANVPSQKKT